MKKVLSLVAIAAMTPLVACGPSAEEKAATEKAKQDSLAEVAAADSMLKAAIETDSLSSDTITVDSIQ